MNRIIVIWMAIMSVWTAGVVTGAELGDQAAPIQVQEWVKGGPVDLDACRNQTNIVVVEFWATWCPPCRMSIPHLTELQKKYRDKGVIFVGISKEDKDVIKKFVDDIGDDMAYAVGVDKDGATFAGYMDAFGMGGIPHAFIVDQDGRIAWQGHPMMKMEEAIEEILTGKYNIDMARVKSAAEQKLKEFVEMIKDGADKAEIDKMASELKALDVKTGGIMPDGSHFDEEAIRKQVRLNSLILQYQQAVRTEASLDESENIIKEIKACAPEDFDVTRFQQDVQLFVTFQKYYQAVIGSADSSEIAVLADKLRIVQSKNALLLNQCAWALLTDDKIEIKDFDLALSMAREAYRGCNGKNAQIVDTYAKALFLNNRLKDAVRLQRKAVKLSNDENEKKALIETLKQYQGKMETSD